MTFHDSKTLEIRRAYYACVSFADQQIGRVGLMLRTSSSPPCQGATRSWRAWSSREHGGHVCRRPWPPGGHNCRDKAEQRTPSISLESMQSGTNKPILRLHIVPPSCLECRELLLRWWSQDIRLAIIHLRLVKTIFYQGHWQNGRVCGHHAHTGGGRRIPSGGQMSRVFQERVLVQVVKVLFIFYVC